jgi:phospholipid/cholesterol/gamma-HCH transport system substrate-binding protein
MSRSARLGAFIFGTLVILALGIFIIGGKEYLFTSTFQLKTGFNDVAGLNVGADVLVGGVHSGTVKAIVLPSKSGDQISVVLEMDKATQHILKQDSVASIQTEGLLGNQYVAVSFGSANKPELKNGDTIASLPPLEMAALLDKANGLLASGQTAMDNVTQLTDHLKSVTAKVDNGTGTVGALVNDRQMYDNLNQTVATLNQTAGSAKTTIIAAQAGVVDFKENMDALKHNFLLRGYFKDRGYEDSSELGKDEISGLPQATAAKEFDFQAKKLFDKQSTAKLKGQKSLNAAGEYLAGNDFGVAVIEVSTGATGSSDDSVTLSQARALVVRDYIVQHYGFDDTKLKTVALGKQTSDNPKENSKDDWGTIRILVYPEGTEVPAAKAAAPKTPAPSN